MTLVLAALCVRALVPEGFMPAQGALIELCTEHGLQRMLVDAETGEILDQQGDAGSPTCPWSLMLPTLAPPAPPATSLILLVGPDTPQRATFLRLAPDGPVLPPARAPPRLS